jgi:hypothetical protein
MRNIVGRTVRMPKPARAYFGQINLQLEKGKGEQAGMPVSLR